MEDRRARQQISQQARRITQRPEVIPGASVAVRKIVIKDGNELDTTQLGIKYSDSEITSVPSAYDPDVDDEFIDGIGRGTLWTNGVEGSGYVLVVNDTRGTFGHALLGDNGDDDGPDVVWAFLQVSIPVDGGGSVSAWVVS